MPAGDDAGRTVIAGEESMKRGIPLNQSKWLIEPGCVVLVTGGTMAKANVMTISWQTPINTADPCLVLLVMGHARYTYELIRQNNELVINVPGEDLLEQTHLRRHGQRPQDRQVQGGRPDACARPSGAAAADRRMRGPSRMPDRGDVHRPDARPARSARSCTRRPRRHSSTAPGFPRSSTRSTTCSETQYGVITRRLDAAE